MIEYLLFLGLAWIAINIAKAIIDNPDVIFRMLCGRFHGMIRLIFSIRS